MVWRGRQADLAAVLQLWAASDGDQDLALSWWEELWETIQQVARPGPCKQSSCCTTGLTLPGDSTKTCSTTLQLVA